MTCKWDNPMEWLDAHLQPMDRNELYRTLHRFIRNAGIDFDTIQNVFQSEMNEDGYFDDQEPDNSPSPYDLGYQAGYSDAEKGIDGTLESALTAISQDDDAYNWSLGYEDGQDDYWANEGSEGM